MATVGQGGLALIGDFQIREGDRQVAQLSFVEGPEAFELELVLVVAQRRGQGLGSHLLGRLLALADVIGKPVLTTARPIGRSSAEALERLADYYRGLGFVELDRGLSSVRMRRPARRVLAGEQRRE